MSVDTSRTAVYAPFAGRERKFQLRMGEMGELERIRGVGVGEIALRLGTHHFHSKDARETVRLGLLGGGASEKESTDLVAFYVDPVPIMDYAGLAASILGACINGVDPPKKAEAESITDPAISPHSTEPAE